VIERIKADEAELLAEDFFARADFNSVGQKNFGAGEIDAVGRDVVALFVGRCNTRRLLAILRPRKQGNRAMAKRQSVRARSGPTSFPLREARKRKGRTSCPTPFAFKLERQRRSASFAFGRSRMTRRQFIARIAIRIDHGAHVAAIHDGASGVDVDKATVRVEFGGQNAAFSPDRLIDREARVFHRLGLRLRIVAASDIALQVDLNLNAHRHAARLTYSGVTSRRKSGLREGAGGKRADNHESENFSRKHHQSSKLKNQRDSNKTCALKPIE
jgi:hypothetical protein